MVEYRYALVLEGGLLGPVSHPSPPTRERCMDRIQARAIRLSNRDTPPARVRVDYSFWMPPGLFPVRPCRPDELDGYDCCPVWIDDEVVGVILRREFRGYEH